MKWRTGCLSPGSRANSLAAGEAGKLSTPSDPFVSPTTGGRQPSASNNNIAFLRRTGGRDGRTDGGTDRWDNGLSDRGTADVFDHRFSMVSRKLGPSNRLVSMKRFLPVEDEEGPMDERK